MMTDLRRADWRDKSNISGLVASYNKRYGDAFWRLFEELVSPAIPKRIIEFGCGPGLFLVDCVRRLGAIAVCGIDASDEMLSQARRFLEEFSTTVTVELMVTDLDQQLPDLPHESADLVFMGFLLHELDHPREVLKLAYDSLASEGVCMVFDYVSGDRDAFVRNMTASGMSEAEAQRRYIHMCRYSIDDIDKMLKDTGLTNTRYVRPDEFRVLICGTRP